MARVRIKEIDSLFVLRHAQRADKLAATVSSIDFDYSHHLLEVHDSYNPPLATYHATQNKSNNGYTQSRALGAKVYNYVKNHVQGSTVVLKFHTSPYLRCIETIKYMVDYLVKHHEDSSRQIKVLIRIDQVLSEWLNTELDVNYYPPNDNGATLLGTAIQYLNSNIPYNRNDNVKIVLNLSDSYKHGSPGAFSESFMQQFSRLNRGIISIVKDTQNNLSPGPDTKDILLVMTHGACVRSIVSKIMGKSLMLEVPLASATLAKPEGSDSKHYYWKVEETDIELRNNLQQFKPVDLYSTRDPFQDIQTTFNTSLSSQLNFKSDTPASKSDNFSRIRSQSLLTPKVPHDSDSDDDSEDEGISFNVHPSRRSQSSHSDHHARRFRSSSLFGPILNNPFFDDQKRVSSRTNSFERVKASLKREDQVISPIENRRPSSANLSSMWSSSRNTPRITPSPRNTPTITPTPSSSNFKIYQNIDEDDGIHDPSSGETVPDLAELSSNNSSSNSLHEDSRQKSHTPPPTTMVHSETLVKPVIANDTETHAPTEGIVASSSSVSLATIKPSGTSLFDKSLIEESLKEIHRGDSPAPPFRTDWMQFRDKTAAESGGENKYKIDLYGKKNRSYKLSLYDDGEDDDSGGGWFLGSNRY